MFLREVPEAAETEGKLPPVAEEEEAPDSASELSRKTLNELKPGSVELCCLCLFPCTGDADGDSDMMTVGGIPTYPHERGKPLAWVLLRRKSRLRSTTRLLTASACRAVRGSPTGVLPAIREKHGAGAGTGDGRGKGAAGGNSGTGQGPCSVAPPPSGSVSVMVRRWRLIGHFPFLYNPLPPTCGARDTPANLHRCRR
jgi:hypothetical protein